MTPFFKQISFRIWLPFAISLFVLVTIVAVYYPNKQEQLFRQNKERELKELAKTVALGVELSLRADDFQGLRKTIDFVSTTSDFEYVAIIVADTVGKESVFISYPEKPENEILIQEPEKYVYEEFPFRTENLQGKIQIAASKEKINALVYELNEPVYILLFITLISSLFLFYLFAKRISKPIRLLTDVSKELEKENYNIVIPPSLQKDEIGDLRNALVSLQGSLKQQKSRNEQLTLGLEDEIKIRTIDLEKTQETLLQAQKVARIGHYEYHFESNTWTSSQTMNEIFGIEESYERNIDNWANIVSPNEREEMMHYFRDIVANKKRFERDYKITRINDGEERWVYGLGELKFDETGKPISLAGTIQDITERKRVEEEVSRLSLVAKNTSNSVIITDKDKNIVWANESMINLSGYSFDELIGRSPKMFQFEKTDPNTIEYIGEKLSKQELVNAEILNRGKLGNEYWLEINIVPVFDSKQELTGYIAVETDITARKIADEALRKSEDQFKRMNETLEQKVLENTKKNLDLSRSIVEQEKLATIGEISAGIAHDLNTPLGAIKVGTESVQFTIDSLITQHIAKCSEEQVQMAIKIAKGTSMEIFVGGLQLLKERKEMLEFLQSKFGDNPNNLGTIAELLTKCRILTTEEQTIEKLMQWNNAADVLELIYDIQMTNNLLETIKTSVEKATKVVKDVRAFIKNETTVERTVVNLKDNISTVLNIFNFELKRNINLTFEVDPNIFIPGYDIKLFQLWSNLIKNAIDAMDEQTEKMISIHSELHDNSVDIIIKNNGPIIPEDVINKIFKKFFTTKQKKNGTGLGLSIVKNVVDEHGAKIAVTSGDGITTFIVTFNSVINSPVEA